MLVWLAELRDVAHLPTLAKIKAKSIERGSPVSEATIRRILSGETYNSGSAGAVAYALAELDTRPVSSRPSHNWDAFDVLLRSKLKAVADAADADEGQEAIRVEAAEAMEANHGSLAARTVEAVRAGKFVGASSADPDEVADLARTAATAASAALAAAATQQVNDNGTQLANALEPKDDTEKYTPQLPPPGHYLGEDLPPAMRQLIAPRPVHAPPELTWQNRGLWICADDSRPDLDTVSHLAEHVLGGPADSNRSFPSTEALPWRSVDGFRDLFIFAAGKDFRSRYFSPDGLDIFAMQGFLTALPRWERATFLFELDGRRTGRYLATFEKVVGRFLAVAPKVADAYDVTVAGLPRRPGSALERVCILTAANLAEQKGALSGPRAFYNACVEARRHIGLEQLAVRIAHLPG
ncbi:hypothetical protein ACFWVC_28215 [Streptomyces sp. NPDC058691]|uniref:hypothetical protein n=1 Tax=Streptomyces sp. NPDC058691 TaxID=3346601 RepID=UPI003658F47B